MEKLRCVLCSTNSVIVSDKAHISARTHAVCQNVTHAMLSSGEVVV